MRSKKFMIYYLLLKNYYGMLGPITLGYLIITTRMIGIKTSIGKGSLSRSSRIQGLGTQDIL